MTEQAQHFDFDSFMKEHDQVGPTVTVFGKVEQLPPSLPAIIMVKTMRLMKSKGRKAETEVQDLLEMAYAIFGEKRLDGWFKQGLSMNGLEVLLKHSIEMYQKTPRGGE